MKQQEEGPKRKEKAPKGLGSFFRNKERVIIPQLLLMSSLAYNRDKKNVTLALQRNKKVRGLKSVIHRSHHGNL